MKDLSNQTLSYRMRHMVQIFPYISLKHEYTLRLSKPEVSCVPNHNIWLLRFLSDECFRIFPHQEMPDMPRVHCQQLKECHIFHILLIFPLCRRYFRDNQEKLYILPSAAYFFYYLFHICSFALYLITLYHPFVHCLVYFLFLLSLFLYCLILFQDIP